MRLLYQVVAGQGNVAFYSTRIFEHYREGFVEDLDKHYSGINALGIVTVMTKWAATYPRTWSESFQDDEEAERELKKKDELAKLSGGVTLSLEASKARLERAGTEDMWFNITLADLDLLTSKRPSFVARQYRIALIDAKGFEIDAVRRQLALYEQLAVTPDNVAEALKVISTACCVEIGRWCIIRS